MATITTAELALELNTTPRELRKFLRADFRESDKGDELPGKGRRYAIEKKHIKGLKRRFDAWSASKEEARNARTAPESPETDTAPELPETPETDETPISLDDLEGPTEDELLELDD